MQRSGGSAVRDCVQYKGLRRLGFDWKAGGLEAKGSLRARLCRDPHRSTSDFSLWESNEWPRKAWYRWGEAEVTQLDFCFEKMPYLTVLARTRVNMVDQSGGFYGSAGERLVWGRSKWRQTRVVKEKKVSGEDGGH